MSEEKKTQIFRQKTLDRISSPEQLTDYLHVTNVGVWVVFSVIILLLAAFFVWASLGKLETTVTSEWRIIKDYHKKKDDKGSGRAIIALARKISRIVFVMLSKREAFNPDLMQNIDQNFQQTA